MIYIHMVYGYDEGLLTNGIIDAISINIFYVSVIYQLIM